MKRTLLATVAVAALAIGGTVANAQERGGAEMKSPSSAQSSGAMSGGSAAEPGKMNKAAPRAAQSEPNHGAAQSGHATGASRAAEQRDATQPNHDTGKARAEDRRPDMNKSSAADSGKADASKHQAQGEHRDSHRRSASEPQHDRSKDQARGEHDRKDKSTAAGEHDRSKDQAQKATDSKEKMKSSAAKAEQDKNSASAASDKSEKRTDRVGSNDRGGERMGSGASRSEDVNVTGSIQVDRQKATRVHDELIRSAPRANVNISVNVGTRLPGHVHVRPVPSSIVSISPEFRGYDYVVVHDEIVIVEPKTRKVVTIIESKGKSHKAQRASLTLNAKQKSRIRSDIRMDDARDFDVEVRAGRVVPQTVVLAPLPDVIYTEVPEVRDYRYFVDDRRIVIVDPDTREVVDIID